jgi:hypothetical protein
MTTTITASRGVRALRAVDAPAWAYPRIRPHRHDERGADVDWATVSIHSRDTALTERVLRAWDEHLADPSLPRTLGARLRSAGFEGVRVEAHAFAASGRDPGSYGAALVPFIATFVAGRPWHGGSRSVGRGAARADGTRRALLREHAVLLHSDEIRLDAPAGRSASRAREREWEAFGTRKTVSGPF